MRLNIVVASEEEEARLELFDREVSTLISSVTNKDANGVLVWADEQESLPISVIAFVASVRAGFASRYLQLGRDLEVIRKNAAESETAEESAA